MNVDSIKQSTGEIIEAYPHPKKFAKDVNALPNTKQEGTKRALRDDRRAIEELDFSKDLPPLLDEIAKNSTLRGKIVGVDINDTSEVEGELEEFLDDRIISTFNYSVRICDPGDVCGLSEYPKSRVFASERIIASTFHDYDPKKLKIFVWMRN